MLFGGVNEGTKERWEAILRLVSKQGGLKAGQAVQEKGFPQRTVECDLGQLKEKEDIVYKGSSKAGVYYLNMSEEQ